MKGMKQEQSAHFPAPDPALESSGTQLLSSECPIFRNTSYNPNSLTLR